MASISILKDVVRDAAFGLIIKEQENLSFYGFHELGTTWADEAKSAFNSSGSYELPDGISQTAFKTVPKSTIDSLLTKTAKSQIVDKSFAEVIFEKIATLKPVFSGRVKFVKENKLNQKTLQDKVIGNSKIFEEKSKIEFRIRKFLTSNYKSSFALGIKNSGLAIESKSGAVISAKNDNSIMQNANALQEKLGNSFARRFIREKNLDSITNSTNRRAIRRAKSLVPHVKSGKTRIEIAKKEIQERF